MSASAIGACVAAFVIGAIPFGVVISRLFFRRDLRAEGSGNIGAANALRALGKRGAIAVLVLDALKGAVAVWLGRAACGDPVGAAAAVAAVLGHCFSPFLRWRGGKGVATSLGAIVTLAWPAGLAFVAVWLAVVAATGYASAGSMLGSLAAVPALGAFAGAPGWWYGGAAAVIVITQHRGNIARLRTGTENVLPIFGRGKSKA